MKSVEILIPQEISVRPWQTVATDLFHFDGSNFILIVDYYSKYLFVQKLSNFSSQEVINMIKQVFGDNGITERVISDNGLHYNSAAYNSLQKNGDLNSSHCLRDTDSLMGLQNIACSQ